MNRFTRAGGAFLYINGAGQKATERYRGWEIRTHRQVMRVKRMDGSHRPGYGIVYQGVMDLDGLETTTATYTTAGQVKRAVDAYWSEMERRSGRKERQRMEERAIA